MTKKDKLTIIKSRIRPIDESDRNAEWFNDKVEALAKKLIKEKGFEHLQQSEFIGFFTEDFNKLTYFNPSKK